MHHDAMVNDPEFQTHFQAYVSFDKEVCSCFLLMDLSSSTLLIIIGAMLLLTRRSCFPPKLLLTTHSHKTILHATTISNLMISPPSPFIPFQNPSFPHCVSDVGKKMATGLHVVMHPHLVRRSGNGLSSTEMVTSCGSQTTKPFALASILEHVPPPTSPMDYMSALCAMMPTMWPSPALKIDYNHIVVAYYVEGWVMALHECNLKHYLNIVHNLIYGSPIGNPPLLTYTFIPHNMPSATEHSAGVNAHILDKLKAE
jgi:hypothetical protein